MLRERESKAVIKYDHSTHTKLSAFLKTNTEKFYLGIDGVLSIVPIENNQSIFGGRFKDGALTDIPAEYQKRITKHLEELTYTYLVLTDKAN